jgi:hypothetical protein
MQFIIIDALLFITLWLFPPKVFANPNANDDTLANSNESTSKDLSFDIADKGFFRGGEWYFSWGYNKSYYSNSDININQSSLDNNFTVNNVQGHDEFGAPTCCTPDNIRIGRFFDGSKNWGIEFNADHTKFTSTDGQNAFVSGVNNGSLGTGYQTLTNNNFSYLLHNGLNHWMINLVYRKSLFGDLNESSSLVFIGKIGAGLSIVHPQNIINGYPNDVGDKNLINNLVGLDSGWWRIVGTSSGLEAGVRYTFYKPFYFELTDKQVFSNMSNVPVYNGHASQNLWQNEIIFSLGFTFDGTK